MRSAVLLVLAACACGHAGPRFAGGSLPAACADGTWDACAAAARDRQLAATLGITDDARLRAYVQRIVDALIPVTRLARAPRVRLEEFGDTAYVSAGYRLAISRTLLSRLGSEAELAGVLAHELAHLEGHHAQLAYAPTEDWHLSRRDAEGIANERAVELLIRAGYPGDVIARLYERAAREGRGDDDEHPPSTLAAARMRRLAGAQTRGREGRESFLRVLAGTVVSTDRSAGVRVGDAYVIARLGLALDVRGYLSTANDSTRAWLKVGELEVVSAAWGRELAARLEGRRRVRTAAGELVVGVLPHVPPRADSVRHREVDALRDEIVRWTSGSSVVIAVRARGALVRIVPRGADLADAIAALRRATPAELAAGRPIRMRLSTAPRTATVRELVAACVDPDAALALDDPDRVIPAGARFKCTDRKYD